MYQSHMSMYAHTYKCTHAHTHMLSRLHTHSRTDTHTYTHTHTHTHTHVLTSPSETIISHRLQLQSRFNLCCSSPDSKRRARMRWHLLRDVIKTDWWKYANTLTVSVNVFCHYDMDTVINLTHIRIDSFGKMHSNQFYMTCIRIGS